jgi:DNA polymerase lambda
LDDLLAFPLYDLRNHGGLSQISGANAGIVKMLNDLIDHTIEIKAGTTGKVKATHQRRITSFIRGRDAIKDYTEPITSGPQAQKNIPGVGKGIATRISEFLETGTLQELESAVTPEARLIIELTEITGIGEVKARSLITEHGVTSIDDLIAKYKSGTLQIAKHQLTHHIAIGLDYYNDLRQRMTWDEANKIARAITETLGTWDPELIVHVCGSYRRKKATCGDLDVLVSHPDKSSPVCLSDIVQALKDTELITASLTPNVKTKFMGVCKGPSGIGRRIDIRFVDHGSMGAAMLYFTGSGKFNKIMRYHANTRGYTLNEYGLYSYINGVKGDIIPAMTERDIFSKLGFVYLDPTEREFPA